MLCADGSWCVPVTVRCWWAAAPCRWGHAKALPVSLLAECVREGRVARGGAVLTVGVDAARVEDRLAGGELACPGCGGELRPWGWARARVLRDEGGSRV